VAARRIVTSRARFAAVLADRAPAHILLEAAIRASGWPTAWPDAGGIARGSTQTLMTRAGIEPAAYGLKVRCSTN
jgi:hypothetical protein